MKKDRAKRMTQTTEKSLFSFIFIKMEFIERKYKINKNYKNYLRLHLAASFQIEVLKNS